MTASDLNTYMNAFDDCGGPVASEMHAAKSERDALRALLGEWEASESTVDDWALDESPGDDYVCDFCEVVTQAADFRMLPIRHSNDCLRTRTRAALAKGAGDGE